MNIEKANPSDLTDIRDLLAGSNLPGDDLSAASLEYFLVLRDEAGVRGVVGVEPYADVALLRSLVVAPELRGQGAGAQLTAAAEELASELGIARICLLTTTAERFFSSRGYRAIHRDAAPAQIKTSTQFSSLCPSTAIVMVKP